MHEPKEKMREEREKEKERGERREREREERGGEKSNRWKERKENGWKSKEGKTLLGTHFLQDSTLLSGVEGSTTTTYTKREKFERKDKKQNGG